MQLRLAAASYIQAYAVLALPHKQKTHNQLPCALQGIFVPQAAWILLVHVFALIAPVWGCLGLAAAGASFVLKSCPKR